MIPVTDVLADFERESLYTPDAWHVDEVLEIDHDADRILARTDTQRIARLVTSQRDWPGHPKHVPGAVTLQITGTLGNLHAIYVMGLRMTEGWVGFGTHVHEAKFKELGKIGPPMDLEATVERKRAIRGSHFVTYAFRFSQEGREVYRSRQTAVWTRTEPGK